MIYRTEHPKPQFMRENWENLNGIWDFEIDNGNSGKDRRLFAPGAAFSGKINVPFCPESKLSGVENVDFMTSVWYRRSFSVTETQMQGRIRLHFGAVDYEAAVYLNGRLCGSHKGGYASFWLDITDYVQPGENVLTVNACDDTRSRLIPSGKQSDKFKSYGCYYTRTTGIWQTVWLEFLPQAYIESAAYETCVENASLTIRAQLKGKGMFRALTSFAGEPTGEAEVFSTGGETVLTVPLSQKHLWEIGQGRLYDLQLTFGDDVVNSYFGLRSVAIDGNKLLLNGKPVFQRLVLDQGFYPDGIYTAPSDAQLEGDIICAQKMGFQGARLHEKVFEERFLYHCDRLGYIVWGEYPNWGLDHSYSDSIYGILPEWIQVLQRDQNHPAIIGWCPFNETWDCNGRKQYDDLLRLVYQTTKAIDPTRPCIDTSGLYHTVTDIYDLHDYEQDSAVFASHYETLGTTNNFSFQMGFMDRQRYDGKQPFFVSEYGGIQWSADPAGWGYGTIPETPEAFLVRLKGLTDVLLDNPYMCGFCYTQLTDVEQEQNGLYTYHREPKFSPEQIYPILSRKASIED